MSAAAIVVGNAPAVADASRAVPAGALPPITILPAQGVQTKLDLHTAQLIAHDLLAAKPSAGAGPLRIWLVQGVEQGPPTATVQLAGLTYHLHQTADGHWALPSAAQCEPGRAPPPVSSALRGVRLTNVAPAVGLDFRQGSFRYGVSNDDHGDDGRRGLLARLQRRRLAGPVRGQLVRERRHARGGRRTAGCRARSCSRTFTATSATSPRQRTPVSRSRATAASPRI